MREATYEQVKEWVEFNGIHNPKIWIKHYGQDSRGKYAPTGIYIDDDGDIVLEIDKELL